MKALFGAVKAVRPVPHGYRFEIGATPVLLAQTGEFMALERLCCPFFHLSVDLPSGAPAFVQVTGPEGVEPFIEAEFASALPPGVTFPRAAGGRA